MTLAGTEHDPLAIPLDEQAEALRLLLWMTDVEVREVIAWADAAMQKTDEPPDWLIDVSLATNDSAGQLRERLARPIELSARHRGAFIALATFAQREQALRDPFKAASSLQRWASAAEIDSESALIAQTPYWIAEDVRGGVYGSVKDVDDHVRAAIKKILATRA